MIAQAYRYIKRSRKGNTSINKSRWQSGATIILSGWQCRKDTDSLLGVFSLFLCNIVRTAWNIEKEKCHYRNINIGLLFMSDITCFGCSLSPLCHFVTFPSKICKSSVIWDKVFKGEPSKTCGRQPLKNLKGYGLLKQTIPLQIL